MTDLPMHPGWCDPRRCDASDPTLDQWHGAHRSELIELELAPLVIGTDRLQVASAYLWRRAGHDRPTFLVVESTHGSLSMPLLKATSVLIQIARLVGRGEVAA